MSVPEWQMPGYENLRIKIIQQAVSDYRVALKKSRHKGEKCDKETELERFFLSAWGQTLSGNNGEHIIEKCRNERQNKRRVNPGERPEEEQIRITEDYMGGMTEGEVCQKYQINRYHLQKYARRWA